MASVAWSYVILPIRVTDTDGYTTYSLLSKGPVYAADRGAKAAVMSLQIFNGSSLSSTAKYLMDRGGLAVTAADNTGKYEDYTDNPYIVSVGAGDGRGVVRVELYKNGVLFAVDSEEPYEFYWDTTTEPDGAYTLVARAYNAAGNIGESGAVSANIVNSMDVKPPTLSIISLQIAQLSPRRSTSWLPPGMSLA
ncbi:MAG: Ig-like domain-containing protein [Candidatus Bathyarchaeia archaeon]